MAKQTETFKTDIKSKSKPPKDKGRKVVEKKALALKTLAIEYIPIHACKPNKYNPNRQSEHDFDLLKKSITEDGFTQPVIVRRSSNEIVDGEHRWRAAQALDYTEIPVVYVEMSEEQMRIATLRHNRARGSEDIELSAQVLRELRDLGALDWAADSLNMDEAELNSLMEDIAAPEALAGEEFGESWEPKTDASTGTDEAVQGDTKESAKGPVMAGSTPQAVSEVRRQEVALASAKTEEEKQAVLKDSRTYRVSLVFASDEADVVKEALGDTPAVTLLEMCRARVAAKG
jgi:ParB/RepB/Spo0J family partition protein